MRTITGAATVYDYAELDDDAKEKALKTWQTSECNDSLYFHESDIYRSLKRALENTLDYYFSDAEKHYRLCFDGYQGELSDIYVRSYHAPTSYDCCEWGDGLVELCYDYDFLYKWNEHAPRLAELRKEYEAIELRLEELGDDSDEYARLDERIRDVEDYFDTELRRTLGDFVTVYEKLIEDEREWVLSEEYAADCYSANDYEFFEDGSIYFGFVAV